MNQPENKPAWNTGPTERLEEPPRPRRSVHPVPTRAPSRPRNRRPTCGLVFIGFLVTLLIVGGGGTWYALNRFQNVTDGMVEALPTSVIVAPNPQQGQPLPAATPDIVRDPFNVLLIGVDSRDTAPDEGARSDTLIVVHVDPNSGWASMLSIPRDVCAPIPGYTAPGGCMKVNAAYSLGYDSARDEGAVSPYLGGAALARDTVTQYLDLPSRGQRIDYVMQVDFNGFKEIIDEIGGITLDVQKPLIDPTYPSDDGDYGLIRLFIPAGVQHMDGTTALRYARSRHTTGDYNRAERQQQVIQAILQSLQARGLLDQIETLDSLADELANTFKTDMPINEIGNLRALASLASRLTQPGRIATYTLGPFADVGGLDINTPRWSDADIAARVDEWLGGPPSVSQAVPENTTPINEALRIEVMNGASIRGLAGEVSEFLAAAGYTTNEPSTASSVYDETLIIDYGDHPDEREQLATFLGIKRRNILGPNRAPETPADPTTDLVVILGRDYQERWRGSR